MSQTAVSTSFAIQDLSAEGITEVETIDKSRKPWPSMEAIYLVAPSEENVERLIRDFESQRRRQYRVAIQ